MKYAFIVMIAVYLVTFGCNPKSEEEHSSPEKKTEHVSVENAPTTPAPPAHVQISANAVEPAPPTHLTVKTEKAVEAAHEIEAEETGENKWKAIANSASTAVLALLSQDAEKAEGGDKDAKVLPCSLKIAANADTPCPKIDKAAPCVTQGLACPEPAGTPPCGQPIAENETQQPPPCLKHSPVAEKIAAPEEEASEAIQDMVNATNDMVAITKQLVIATQQMLTASKDVAVEVIDSGKDALEASKPAMENAINEEEIIETVKEVVSATKEAFKATSEALSKAIEAKEAAPQQ